MYYSCFGINQISTIMYNGQKPVCISHKIKHSRTRLTRFKRRDKLLLFFSGFGLNYDKMFTLRRQNNFLKNVIKSSTRKTILIAFILDIHHAYINYILCHMVETRHSK